MRKKYDFMKHAYWINAEKIEMFSKTPVPIEQRKNLTGNHFSYLMQGSIFRTKGNFQNYINIINIDLRDDCKQIRVNNSNSSQLKG